MRNCKLCDIVFFPSTNKMVFCSKKCQRKFGKIYLGHSISMGKSKIHRTFIKSECEACGFIPINSCQLDVDHIDGNHNNNDLENLQTLCANCHRLKTFLNRDWG